MISYRPKNVLLTTLVSCLALLGAVHAVHSSTLDSILNVSEEKNEAARESQARIDRLADETRDLLSDYKSVMKQIDGLKVYNTDCSVRSITRINASRISMSPSNRSQLSSAR